MSNRELLKKFNLPKINHTEISTEIIPERVNIYSKVKIQDLMGLGKYMKPIFK